MLEIKFIRFLFVGALNTAFGYLMYAIFISTPLPHWAALFCSYVCGVLWNFKTTGTLVFKNGDNRLIFKFISTYVFTYFINLFCLKSLLHLDVNKYIAQFILVFPIAILSFILFKLFVFKEPSKPKIIMRYGGGLGNQIFQYIVAASLAKKLGCEFEFDTSSYKNKRARAFEMGIFGVESNKNYGWRVKLYWLLRRPLKALGQIKNFFGLKIYEEQDFTYEQRFENISENTFIVGFFQSAKYFDPELVKEKLQFIEPPQGLNKELIEKINSENSVSIHVRRGDYVQKKRFFNIYNQLGTEYYSKAIAKIKENVENPTFYVFSDDIEWVKENLKIEQATFVEHNRGENSWQDLRLMSECKHSIIANSSFSFWGAFLGSSPHGIVIAPEKWFKEDIETKSTRDIYPENWLKI